MKLMKHENPDFETLVACASSDKKRPAYQVVYSDNEEGVLITTDGSRLFATRSLPLAKETGTYKIVDYAERGEFEPAQTDFPRWQSLIQHGFKYYLTFTVPEFVERLNPKNKNSRALVTLLAESKEGVHRAVITLDHDTTVGEDKFTLNLANLQPLAGKRIKIHVPGDNSWLSSHFILISDPGEGSDIKTLPWFMLVIAARAGKDTVTEAGYY